MASSELEVLVLVSNDGERYEVSLEVAKVFRAVEAMLESGIPVVTDTEPIPLPNVNGRILGKIIAWAEQYVRSLTPPPVTTPTSQVAPPTPVQPVQQPKVVSRRQVHIPPVAVPSQWESQFIERNKVELYDLLLAANYLDAKRLMDLLCNAIASSIRGKDPAVIRKIFNASEPTNENNSEQLNNT